ncbi:MAG: hypothetical protein EOP48_12290 [Sphingobacteriales bacterium]|nr:MAG: hypothetical protein EOP48_12290 [Sphingobacteriales bacterium]
MASQSVWGTVESQIILQRLTVVGVNLLFLWALSPLGGQASLRLMQRHDRLTTSNTTIRYMTTGPGGTMWGLSSTYVGSGKFSDAGALYTAALLAPLETKVGPIDPWGNVKIPRVDFSNSTSASSSNNTTSGTNVTSNNNSTGTTNNTNIYYTVTGAPGQYQLSDFSDWRNDFFSNPEGYFTTFMGNRDYTPYVAKDLRRQTGKSDDLLGNLELNLKATNWLDFVYRIGLATNNTNTISTTEAYKRSAFLAPGGGRTYPSDYDISAQVNNGYSFSSTLSSNVAPKVRVGTSRKPPATTP